MITKSNVPAGAGFPEDDRLLRRPNYTALIGVAYAQEKWNAMLNVIRVGNREDLFFGFFGATAATRVKVDQYTRVDLAGRYNVWENIDMVARVENLLDEEYEDVLGFPNPRLAWMIGVEIGWEF